MSKNNAKNQPAEENLGKTSLDLAAEETTQTAPEENTETEQQEQTDASIAAPGDVVKFVPTEQMCENMGWDTEKVLSAKVENQKPSGETMLTIELRPGQTVQAGCFYNKKALPGTWHR